MTKIFISKLKYLCCHNQNRIIVKKLFLLVVLGCTTTLFAQSPVRLGAHFDPIFSWFSPKTSQIGKDGARLGYNGGLIVEYYFAPNYAFVSGLNFTMIGG